MERKWLRKIPSIGYAVLTKTHFIIFIRVQDRIQCHRLKFEFTLTTSLHFRFESNIVAHRKAYNRLWFLCIYSSMITYGCDAEGVLINWSHGNEKFKRKCVDNEIMPHSKRKQQSASNKHEVNSLSKNWKINQHRTESLPSATIERFFFGDDFSRRRMCKAKNETKAETKWTEEKK